MQTDRTDIVRFADSGECRVLLWFNVKITLPNYVKCSPFKWYFSINLTVDWFGKLRMILPVLLQHYSISQKKLPALTGWIKVNWGGWRSMLVLSQGSRWRPLVRYARQQLRCCGFRIWVEKEGHFHYTSITLMWSSTMKTRRKIGFPRGEAMSQ
jgi:hypothetical protein